MVSGMAIHPDTAVPKQRSKELVQVFIGFWFLGLINNAGNTHWLGGKKHALSFLDVVYA